MATIAIDPKQQAQDLRQQAHALIDGLGFEQIHAVVDLLRVMLETTVRPSVEIPFEDEEISAEEERAVAASNAWMAEHPNSAIPMEEIMAEFGFSVEDIRQ